MDEQREDIIKDNNTAQEQLLGILAGLPKSTKELIIEETLFGDIDFSVLKSEGYGNIKTIILKDGQITNIAGLYEGLLHFECINNLLIELEDLPVSLKHLKIPFNHITALNVSKLENLETLVISHNQIPTLENLSKKLTELSCDNNKLQFLNLDGLVELKTLNISNNRITLIENLPVGIIDFKMENTPAIEFRNSVFPEYEKDLEKDGKDEEEKKNYLEALNEFFRLKNEYQTKASDMMKKAFKKESSRRLGKLAALSVKPPCINCKRPVGTIFSNRENDKYTAICGDKGNPCNLNIKIFNGRTINLVFILNVYQEEINDIKDLIIRQKLDTLFSYTTEEKSVELFKKELENYNANSKIFKDLLVKYNELYNNKEKEESINKKTEKIYLLIEKVRDLIKEYKKTENHRILKTAVDVQINELFPEIRNMKLLLNEVVELNQDESGKFTIFNYPVALNKIDYDFGEKASVIKFQKD
uniref:Uncharacterized protein n=1 Tax=viral metagenome TaxID=1070528 RepID=A0A6C0JEN0_9ZZZZ